MIRTAYIASERLLRSGCRLSPLMKAVTRSKITANVNNQQHG